MAQAAVLVKAQRPDLEVEGELMADYALRPDLLLGDYPFSALRGQANVLVFPSLAAANIAYKLLQQLGGAISALSCWAWPAPCTSCPRWPR